MLKKFILIAVLVTFGFSLEINYTKEDVCLIRKVKIYKNPLWVAKIKTSSGKVALFCSPKSMFEFYFKPYKFEEYGAETADDIDEIIVTDYLTLKPINARSAYFVYGSNKTSPAGDDLVAFEKKVDAQIYANKYNGKRVLRFSKISQALIDLLNGSI